LIKKAAEIADSDRDNWEAVDTHSGFAPYSQTRSPMSTYLGHVQTVCKKFHQHLPLSTNIATQEKNYDKLFLLLTLAGLPDDTDSVH
jgi:hypothetical protein